VSNHRCASPSRPLSPMVLVTPPPRAAVQARRCHTVAVLGRRTSVPVSRILITKKVVLLGSFSPLSYQQLVHT
jgi:hypothetical protein